MYLRSSSSDVILTQPIVDDLSTNTFKGFKDSINCSLKAICYMHQPNVNVIMTGRYDSDHNFGYILKMS